MGGSARPLVWDSARFSEGERDPRLKLTIVYLYQAREQVKNEKKLDKSNSFTRLKPFSHPKPVA